MKYISLFAGIGGFDLALNRQGHECVYANEWDKYAAQIYEKNFNHKPDTRDITAVDVSEIPDHDLLVGGFPCQSFSIAGKRKGFTETRGTLFFEICRIAAAKRTKFLLLENVEGLLSHDNNKTFRTIIRTLDELGYDLQWQIINSKNHGVPQNRSRIFIIGNLRTEPRPQVFPISLGNSDFVSGDQKRQDRVADTLTSRYAKGGRGTHLSIGTNRTHKDGRGFREIREGISPTIPARAREDGSGQPVVAMRWARTEAGKEARRIATKKLGKDYTPFNGGSRQLEPKHENVVGTLTSALNKDSLIGNEFLLRRLTPLECERLQGFPDGWTKYGVVTKGQVLKADDPDEEDIVAEKTETVEISDSQRYKCLGNAVTVNVIEAIVQRL